MNILIINGPNLNLIGQREPKLYGNDSFLEFLESLKHEFKQIQISYFQSNIEGEIINRLHKTLNEQIEGIILNAGAYTHYSIAMRDAIKAIKIPVIEVHISNIYSREEFRQKSVISAVCIGSITGFGLQSYKLAIYYFLNQKNNYD